MDTHVTAHPSIDSTEFSARLPGEMPEPLIAPSPSPPTASANDAVGDAKPASLAPRRRRGRLLAGVAVVALVGVAATGFAVSPYNHIMPMPGFASSLRHAATYAENYAQKTVQREVMAPAAKFAEVTLPPPKAPPVRPHVELPSADAQVEEVTGLKHLPPASPATARAPDRAAAPAVTAQAAPALQADGPPRPPEGYVAREPGTAAATSSAGSGTRNQATWAPTDGQAPATTADAARTAKQEEGGRVEVAGASPPKPATVRLDESTAGKLRDITDRILSEIPGAHPGSQPDAQPAAAPASVVPPPAAEIAAEVAPDAGPDAAIVTAAFLSDRVVRLRAAPMSEVEQIKVLDMVNQLSKLVGDLRRQDDQLRDDVSRMTASSRVTLADFSRRLSMAEASQSLADASEVGNVGRGLGSTTMVRAAPGPQDNAGAVSGPASAVKVVPISLTRVDTAGAAGSTPKHYRVQAASPGMAMLAELDRGGGEGAQISISVGDTLPDYGRVKSISQHGSAWVVETEHGSIQQ